MKIILNFTNIRGKWVFNSFFQIKILYIGLQTQETSTQMFKLSCLGQQWEKILSEDY